MLVLSALVLLSAASGAWLLLRGDEPAAAASTTATVSKQTLKQSVTASGTVAARTTDESVLRRERHRDPRVRRAR
ncbi:hypothetical protein G5V59_27160 [Nocardioides sp. W3-2-3]|uniref:hypothetical protein n=1 Tax=Nocardioides convexus TaxID=2712224 RepID=UPI0024184539|nr:hypothetical protein [Nocardioides convexus]NHA02071.1 hypothetical protein [Nocardioides convexus]